MSKPDRWGILPDYHGWKGDVVHTEPTVEAAILQAMGADTDDPPEPRPPPEVVDGDRCEPAPERAWGWAVQLYALRSRESWGVGDFADLRRFGRWARQAGASVILLNPLGAQNPRLPYEASPYYASTRRFRNTIYLSVDEVEGAGRVDLNETREEALQLNAQRIIDYD